MSFAAGLGGPSGFAVTIRYLRCGQSCRYDEGAISVSVQKTLKHIHIASTVWFVLCIAYILVLALRQAGVQWWVVFSLSGHGVLVAFLLISLYLFAIFRGISSSQKVQVEHPLTSTTHYAVFYVIIPFLGALASCLGMIGVNRIGQFMLGVTLGTLGTTFSVWVILDPAIGLLEMLLPASRKHRAQRLARAKAEREKKHKDREHLMAQVLAQEESDRRYWQEMLRPQAEKLASVLTANRTDFKQAERDAIGIGVCAWQIGGQSCMRELRDMTVALCKQSRKDRAIVDYISFWWDGIGSWRAPSVGQSRGSLIE